MHSLCEKDGQKDGKNHSRSREESNEESNAFQRTDGPFPLPNAKTPSNETECGVRGGEKVKAQGKQQVSRRFDETKKENFITQVCCDDTHEF